MPTAAPRPNCCPGSTPSPTASWATASAPSPPRCTTSRSASVTASPSSGFTSVDYTVVDIALTQLGAVSVPLQTSAPQAQLQPIVAETEPSLIATSIDYVADAVALTRAGHAPARLVVFDYRPEVDAHREAFEAAKAALADTSVVVETLATCSSAVPRLPGPIARLRRRRRTRAAGVHLRQHRRPEGCDLLRRARSPTCGGHPRAGTGTTSRACCPRSR